MWRLTEEFMQPTLAGRALVDSGVEIRVKSYSVQRASYISTLTFP